MDNTQDPAVTPTPPETGQEQTPKEVPNTEAGEKLQAADVAAETEQAPQEATTEEAKPEETKDFQMPEKFVGKSAEEIAQSYTELESHNKKVEMEKAEIDKFINDAYATEQPKATPEPKAEQPAEAAADAPLTREQALKQVADELRPMLKAEMQAAITPAVARLEVKEMVDKYGEPFKAVAGKIAEAKKANPSLSLDDAYKIVTYNTVSRTSEIKGIKQASETAEAKVKAQAESSRPSGIKPTGIEEAVKDPNVGVGEIAEALGSEYNAFAKISKERKGKYAK